MEKLFIQTNLRTLSFNDEEDFYNQHPSRSKLHLHRITKISISAGQMGDLCNTKISSA